MTRPVVAVSEGWETAGWQVCAADLPRWLLPSGDGLVVRTCRRWEKARLTVHDFLPVASGRVVVTAVGVAAWPDVLVAAVHPRFLPTVYTALAVEVGGRLARLRRRAGMVGWR